MKKRHVILNATDWYRGGKFTTGGGRRSVSEQRPHETARERASFRRRRQRSKPANIVTDSAFDSPDVRFKRIYDAMPKRTKRDRENRALLEREWQARRTSGPRPAALPIVVDGVTVGTLNMSALREALDVCFAGRLEEGIGARVSTEAVLEAVRAGAIGRAIEDMIEDRVTFAKLKSLPSVCEWLFAQPFEILRHQRGLNALRMVLADRGSSSRTRRDQAIRWLLRAAALRRGRPPKAETAVLQEAKRLMPKLQDVITASRRKWSPDPYNFTRGERRRIVNDYVARALPNWSPSDRDTAADLILKYALSATSRPKEIAARILSKQFNVSLRLLIRSR